jgi:hypothetical protein
MAQVTVGHYLAQCMEAHRWFERMIGYSWMRETIRPIYPSPGIILYNEP